MSPQIQQEGLQVEDEGGKEMVLIPLGEGLAGKAAGVGQMPEHVPAWRRGGRQVKLGVTTQKGLCPVKQNAPPVPGT